MRLDSNTAIAVRREWKITIKNIWQKIVYNRTSKLYHFKVIIKNMSIYNLLIK